MTERRRLTVEFESLDGFWDSEEAWIPALTIFAHDMGRIQFIRGTLDVETLSEKD